MLANQATIGTGSEWILAREVQRSFMQRRGPSIGSLDYSAQCRQAHELGGDCYDFSPLPGGRLALTIGDASGKGVAAALMISSVQSSVRTAASFLGDDVAAVIGAANRLVHASSLADRFATLFYAVFDDTTRTLRYVNAGHNSPMVIRRGGSVEWLNAGGAPVGMFPDWTYEEGRVRLDPGDLLIAYTDGVVEATNAAGEEWGIKGMLQTATENRGKNADDIIHSIFEALDEFSGERLNDDATVVVLRV